MIRVKFVCLCFKLVEVGIDRQLVNLTMYDNWTFTSSHLIFRLGLVPAVSIRILFHGDCHVVVEPDQENLKRMVSSVVDHKTIGVQ